MDTIERAPVRRMGEMPPQKQSAAGTDAERRAVYFNPATAFMRTLAPVPSATFVAEAERALDPETPTSVIACDLSGVLSAQTEATTPHLLARYVVLRATERLERNFRATCLVFYAIRGSGTARLGDTAIAWGEGDVFLLPGGEDVRLEAGSTGAVLWAVGNEPALAFEGLRPPPPGERPVEPVHYPAAEIERQMAMMYALEKEEGTAARAIIFSSDQQIEGRNIAPTLSLAYNTLEPGAVQRAHRHNSVAVTLAIRGEKAFSMVDHARKDWVRWSTTITPPCALHSHHNEGDSRALFLIVQDGGIYTNARATGFSFA